MAPFLPLTFDFDGFGLSLDDDGSAKGSFCWHHILRGSDGSLRPFANHNPNYLFVMKHFLKSCKNGGIIDLFPAYPRS